MLSSSPSPSEMRPEVLEMMENLRRELQGAQDRVWQMEQEKRRILEEWNKDKEQHIRIREQLETVQSRSKRESLQVI